jgi:hypothetical protein
MNEFIVNCTVLHCSDPVSAFIVDCESFYCELRYLFTVARATVHCEWIHCGLHCSGHVSAFTIDCTIWWGHVQGCSQQAPSARLEVCPLGLQTPRAWLSGLGAGQATPAGRAPGCSHLARGLPIIRRLGCLLCAGQTKRTRGAWASCQCAGQTKRTSGAWVVACVKNIIIFIIINNFERKYYY